MKYIKLEGPWTPVPHVPHPSHQSREYIMSLMEQTFHLKSHPTMGNERKKHRKEKKKPKKQKP